MNTRELQDLLRDLLDEALACDDEYTSEGARSIASVTTYDEVGMMTNDAGLVVQTEDGGEFQLTIVRSK